MIEIPAKEVSRRLLVDNPWWTADQGVDPYFAKLPRRSYFGLFKDVALQTDVHRAVVLMKTVARWKTASNPRTLKQSWAYEVKWSDQYYNHPDKLKSLIRFTKKNELLGRVGATTKTESGTTEVSGGGIRHFPCSLHCYRIGRNITEGRTPW